MESFNNVLTFVNQNSGFFQLVVTLILVLVTAVYVYLTWRVAKSSEKLNELQFRPNIYVFFYFSEQNELRMIIKNIGPNPAYNVIIRLTSEFDDKIFIPNTFTLEGIFEYPFVPPGFEIPHTFEAFATPRNILHKPHPLNVDISYYDSFSKSKKHKNNYKIDLNILYYISHFSSQS